MLDAVITRLIKGLEAILGLMAATMVVLVFGNVVLRYGFNSGIAVSEEVSRFIFVWMIFLGSIIAVREHSHLGVDSLLRKLPRRGKIFCVVTSDVLILFAMGLLLQGSWSQTLINFDTISPVAGISMAFLYLPGVIASAGIGVLVLIHLYQVLWLNPGDEDLILCVDSEELAALEHTK